jgi:hypothetical protein
MDGTAMADWCPKCKERTSLPDRGICPWCDTPLVVQVRRGGWKRPDLRRRSRLSDTQLRALHLAYVKHGVSINALAKRIYHQVGYKSHHSAATAISEGWKRLELPARDRIEATRLASTTHGHGARDRDEQAYRRFLAEQRGWRALQGPGRPQCKAVKVNPPGAGKPCGRPALADSEYCVSHDPLRAQQREATLAAMRASSPAREMLPMAPFVAWLHELRAELGSYGEVATRIGMHRTQCYRFANGLGTDNRAKRTVSLDVVKRSAAAAGTTVEAIYAPEEQRVAA